MAIARLMLATGNPHKVTELRALLTEILGGDVCELLTPADFPGTPEPVEDGGAFEENALIKARYWMKISSLPALADDSGLVIDALDGGPGIFSARYAATAELRNQKVIDEMAGIADPRRSARFVCAAALIEPFGGSHVERGTVEGSIALCPSGGGGFGYDPIFIVRDPPFAGRAMADLTEAEKNSISHRGRALRAIARYLI